jgi:hypothetical protein
VDKCKNYKIKLLIYQFWIKKVEKLQKFEKMFLFILKHFFDIINLYLKSGKMSDFERDSEDFP